MSNIVFEIGTEELPAAELYSATKQVEDIVSNQPGKLFDYKEVKVCTTPRRIIVFIEGVPEKIEAKKEEFKGPKTEIAFQDGKPSQAAIGFAKGKGVDVSDLVEKDGYVFAVKNTPAKNVKDLLPELFLGLINDIKWKKVQRWGNTSEEFARPIRWLVAMFDSEVVNLEYAGIKASNVTYGHRFLAPSPIKLKDASELLPALIKAYVVLSEKDRQDLILKQVKEIEKSTRLNAVIPEAVLREVVDLCEYPNCLVGEFDKSFLEVPKEIIVDAMLMHQRYFPLFDAKGNLTNKFVVISNGDPKCAQQIIDGNERVVAARLYDAKFFFEEDKKNKLETYVDKLEEVVFQESLGTLKQKTQRVSLLSEKIAKDSSLEADDIKLAKRAGLLAKADLVTGAVVEFTQVQGIMGSYYAQSSGENPVVAQAIKEHYMPRFAGDGVPTTDVAKCVAIADKIDTLCGMFAVGQVPSGSSDPFALRRGAIGIISIMKEGLNFSFVDAVNFSLDLYKKQGIKFDKNKVVEEIIDFVITRTKVSLKDSGVDHDSIEAVSSVKVAEPLIFVARANALDLARKKDSGTFEDLATAFARANNLRDAKLGSKYSEDNMGSEEKALSSAINTASKNISNALKDDSYSAALSELAKLRGPIDEFFDKVMIMDKDKKLQENRLKLLNAFVEVFANIADFSKMAKSK